MADNVLTDEDERLLSELDELPDKDGFGDDRYEPIAAACIRRLAARVDELEQKLTVQSEPRCDAGEGPCVHLGDYAKGCEDELASAIQYVRDCAGVFGGRIAEELEHVARGLEEGEHLTLSTGETNVIGQDESTAER